MTASERLEIRVDPETKARVEEAAHQTHMTSSQFVRSAMEDKLRAILDDRWARTVVSPEVFEELLDWLDEPDEPNEPTIRAARRLKERKVKVLW